MTLPEETGPNETGPNETGLDQILTFTIPARDCRGRIVRLGPAINEILDSHDYPPAIANLLGEALVVTALMGGLLKGEEDQMTMQAQTENGAVDLLVCDYRNGALRGYVKHDREKLDTLGANPSLAALFGKAHLAITFDIASSDQRFQGIVPLEGDTLSEAVEAYFAQSEQVPTLIRTAVRSDAEGCIAAGLLVQHLAEGEDGRERLHVRLDHPEWEHVATMAGSLRHGELIDQTLSLEALVWRLYNEEQEVRVAQGTCITKGCRCSPQHFEEVLARFPKEERRDMVDENGIILVDCAFCSKQFSIQD